MLLEAKSEKFSNASTSAKKVCVNMDKESRMELFYSLALAFALALRIT